jgi:Zinc finger, C3HC4 type (RING finger)
MDHHLSRYAVSENKLSKTQKRELKLLKHAIERGRLFDDEYNRFGLTCKNEGYWDKHSKQMCRDGIVNVIPHIPLTSLYHRFRCAFCNFELCASDNPLDEAWNAGCCKAGLVRTKHTQQVPTCPFLFRDIQPPQTENIPYQKLKDEFRVFERDYLIRFSDLDDVETDTEQLQCMVCLTNERRVLFLNCHHCVLCIDCSEKLRPGYDQRIRCMICREKIVAFCEVKFIRNELAQG